MFRGNHRTRIDEKGRLKLPAEFKRLVDERYGSQFYITSVEGDTADVYPLPEWEKIEAKLAVISNSNPSKRKYLNRVNYYGQTVEMDAQGRILLPQILRESASLLGDVDVLGQFTFLRVAESTLYQNAMKDKFTDEDYKALEDLGF